MTLYQLMNRAIQYLIRILNGQADMNFQLEELRADVAEIKATLARIESAVTPSLAARFVFFIEADGEQKEVTQMQMKVSDKAKIVLGIKDKGGNPAPVDGKPAWSLSDDSFGSLSVADDGLSADFVPGGKAGSGLKVQVSADADLGEGVKTIFGELPIDLLPGEAVSIELAAEVSPQ